MNKGCGISKTMGHGCFATCGKPFYSDGIWYCESCLSKQLIKAKKLLDDLDDLCHEDIYKFSEMSLSHEVASFLGDIDE